MGTERRSPYPPWLLRELRSDHAGETGAVWIYRGVLSVTRNARLRDFAERHLATEQKHLALLNSLLQRSDRSRLLPLWRIAGFLTGAMPALVGPKAVYGTVAAVETFVDRHYQQQIEQLEPDGYWGLLRAQLEDCRLDEVSHLDESLLVGGRPDSALGRIWNSLVGAGSAAAVSLARRI